MILEINKAIINIENVRQCHSSLGFAPSMLLVNYVAVRIICACVYYLPISFMDIRTTN